MTIDEEIKVLKERCDRLEHEVDQLRQKWIDLANFASTLKRSVAK